MTEPGCLKRLFRDESGAVAVEFGIIAIPLFLAIGGMFMTAIDFMQSRAAEEIAQVISRIVMVQNPSDAPALLTALQNEPRRFLDYSKFVITVTNYQSRIGTEIPRVCRAPAPLISTKDTLISGQFFVVEVRYPILWVVPFQAWFLSPDPSGTGGQVRSFCTASAGIVE